MNQLLKDALWIRQSFLVKSKNLELVDRQNRIFSSASLKFTDTTPGGNFAINPAPQFTRFCDLKPDDSFGRGTRKMAGKGMGRYYSEAIDDNQQIINMRFGVPNFNAMTTFFTGFYNSQAGQLARTGRSTGAFYSLGRAVGFVVSILSFKLLAVQALGAGLRFFMAKPSSKYYYLKPTMVPYWNSVQTIVNQIAVNMGIVPRLGGPDGAVNEQLNDKYEFDAAAQAKMKNLLPDIFSDGGSINVYAMANKAQRLAAKHQKLLENAYNESDFDLNKSMQAIYSTKLKDDKGQGYENYISSWLASAQSTPQASAGGASLNPDLQPSSGAIPPPGTATPVSQAPPQDSATESLKYDSAGKKIWDTVKGWGEHLTAEMNDGSQFVGFRVQATGTVNESFSSSVADSEIATKINGIASQSRATNFNFANGNLVGGALGEVLGGAIGAVKNLAAGIGDSFQLSGLATLSGAAFVDIPKHWVSSMASLPKSTYVLDLKSWSGDPISRLINLFVPLAMVLAGGLPISTGRHSYTSPFICELYDQGRCQTRLGMIDSINVVRGTGNTGWTKDGQPLGIEVSFTVVDMSSILHMPISQGFSIGTVVSTVVGGVLGGAGGGALGSVGGPAGSAAGVAAGAALGAAAANGTFDDDTSFSDYMAILGSMSMADQIYTFRKLKLNLTRKMTDWDTWASAPHFISFLGESGVGRLASAFFKGTAR